MKPKPSLFKSIAQRISILKGLAGFLLAHTDRIKLHPEVAYDGEKVVVLVLKKLDYRFYYPIIHHLCAAGYKCYIKIDYRFIQPEEQFFDLILDLKSVCFFVKAPDLSKVSFVMTDSPNANSTLAPKTIQLSDNIFSVTGNFRKDNILPFWLLSMTAPFGAKGAVIESSQKADCSFLFRQHLQRRIQRLFPQYSAQETKQKPDDSVSHGRIWG